MSVAYSIYETETGRIRSYGTAPDQATAALQANEGESIWPEAVRDDLFYIADGAAAERPVLTVADATIPADGADHVIASDLPEGTEVIKDGEPQGEAGGSLEVAAHESGALTLRLAPPFPWREATITVTAT